MIRTPSILTDQSGNSLIEMGLAAPLLAALLVGMIDISRAYSEDLQLEQVAQRTIERVQQSGFDPSHKTALENEAKAAAGAGSSATVAFVLECNGATQTWTTTCSGGQTYARYVNATVTKPFTPMFGAKIFPGANANGTVTLTGEAGIRVQ